MMRKPRNVLMYLLLLVVFCALGLWLHIRFSLHMHEVLYFKSAYDEDTYALFAASGVAVSFSRVASAGLLKALAAIGGSLSAAQILADAFVLPFCAMAAWYLSGRIAQRRAARLLMTLALLFCGDVLSLGNVAIWHSPPWTLAHLRESLPYGSILVPDYTTSYLAILRTPEPQLAWGLFFLAQAVVLSVLKVADRKEMPSRRYWLAMLGLNTAIAFSYLFVSCAHFILLGCIAVSAAFKGRKDLFVGFSATCLLPAVLVLGFIFLRSSGSGAEGASLIFKSHIPEISPGILACSILSALGLFSLMRSGDGGFLLPYGCMVSMLPLVLTNQQIITGHMVSAKDWERHIDYVLLALSGGMWFAHACGRFRSTRIVQTFCLICVLVVGKAVWSAQDMTYEYFLPANEKSVAISKALNGVPADLRHERVFLQSVGLSPLVRLRQEQMTPYGGEITDLFLFLHPIASLGTTSVKDHLQSNAARENLYEYLFRLGCSPEHLRAQLGRELAVNSGHYIAFFFSFLDHWHPASDGRTMRNEEIRQSIPLIVEEYRERVRTPPAAWRTSAMVVREDNSGSKQERFHHVPVSQIRLFNQSIRVFRQEWAEEHTPLADADARRRAVVKIWEFKDGIPTEWTADAKLTVHAREGGGVTVQTVPNKTEYQLWSASPVVLVPGEYEVVVDGEIEHGTVYVGVEDVKRGCWIRNEPFEAPEAREDQPKIALSLYLDAETEVGIRFFTGGGAEQNSLVLHRVDIVEVRHP